MNRRVKKKWLKALRSGEYKQGKGFLRRKNPNTCEWEHCIVGVLCDVSGIKWKLYNKNVSCITSSGTYDVSYLLPEMREKLEISLDDEEILNSMNDKGKTFKQMARWIEAKL